MVIDDLQYGCIINGYEMVVYDLENNRDLFWECKHIYGMAMGCLDNGNGLVNDYLMMVICHCFLETVMTNLVNDKDNFTL